MDDNKDTSRTQLITYNVSINEASGFVLGSGGNVNIVEAKLPQGDWAPVPGSENNGNNLGEQLATQTRHQAAKDSSQLFTIITTEKPIVPVNLQIASKPQRVTNELDEEGHYHRREDFVKLYEQPPGDISPDEMFLHSKKEAVQEADRVCTTEQAKQEFVEKRGNVIGIVGQPGVGKTTSMKKWVQNILEGRIAPNVTCLFFIFVRYIDFSRQVNLLQFLLSTILPTWEHSPELDKAWLKKLSEDQNLVLALDGFDEASVSSLSVRAPKVNLYDTAYPLTFLLNLINGSLFPLARVIVTSRPAQLYNLHPTHRPSFILQILGLNKEGQEELGRQICLGKWDQIMGILTKNANVFTYCYVPVNFLLTLDYLLHNNGQIDLICLTGVLTSACERYSVSEHLKDKECELDKLSKLAWTGYQKVQILFESADLKHIGIGDNTIHSFLNTSVVKSANIKMTIMDGHRRSYFSHLIWQEFFASVYIMLIMPLDEFKSQLPHFCEDRWEVLAKFAFGLCNRSIFNQLKCLLPECSVNLWKAKKNALIDLAVVHMRKFSCHQQNEKALNNKFGQHQGLHHSALLTDCHTVQSTAPNCLVSCQKRTAVSSSQTNLLTQPFLFNNCGQNPQNNQQLSASSQEILHHQETSGGHLLPADHINPLITQQQFSQSLAQPLKDIPESDNFLALASSKPSHIVQPIQSNCSDGAVQYPMATDSLLPDIQSRDSEDLMQDTAGMYNCQQLLRICSWVHEANDDRLTQSVIAHLPKVLSVESNPDNLSVLLASDVSNLFFVLQAAQQAPSLQVNSCMFAREGLHDFLEFVAVSRIQVPFLDLGCNSITNAGVLLLIQCIQYVQRLKLNDCGITNDGVQIITKGLLKASHTLLELILSNNPIEDVGLSSLCYCIQHIHGLKLEECGITSLSMKQFAYSLLLTCHTLQFLDLSHNSIKDAGLETLCLCLPNIKQLSLKQCEITSVGAAAISKRLTEASHTVHLLDLSENTIEDVGLSSLCESLQYLHELKLWDCQITSVGIANMSKKLLEIRHTIRCLDLGRNSITDDGVSSLCECIYLIQELRLVSCGITSTGVEQLAKKLIATSHALYSLDLGDNRVEDAGVSSLCQCIRHFGKLVLWECEITSVGVEELARKLIETSHILKDLDLSNNQLGVKGALGLLPCLHLVGKVDMEDCDIAEDEIDEIRSELARFLIPKEKIHFR